MKTRTVLQEQYLVPLKIILVYIAWKIFHHFAHLPGTILNRYWINSVYSIGCWYASATSFILSLFGMRSNSSGININMLVSNKQVWVQEHCLAIPAMIVFTGAVIFFAGEWKDKMIFIVTGLTGIVLINLLRLVFLSLAWVYLPSYFFKINHSLIYVVAMYGFIFYMVVRWMNRILPKQPVNHDIQVA